jgi:hypothetical protein
MSWLDEGECVAEYDRGWLTFRLFEERILPGLALTGRQLCTCLCQLRCEVRYCILVCVLVLRHGGQLLLLLVLTQKGSWLGLALS